MALGLVSSQVVAPKTGLAVEMAHGQVLRVTDLEGRQVVDTAVFNLHNPREKLSTSYSRTRYLAKPGEAYAPRDHLEEGDWLLSTLCRPLMTILRESSAVKGVHDACNRMCNRFMYEVFGVGPRDGCHEIIAGVIAPYGLRPEDVPDTLDLFMHYPHNCDKGHFEILEPRSEPGDFIEFRAEMDCLVAMSNCPEDVITMCNAKHCTPVEVDVFEDSDAVRGPVLSPAEWLAAIVRQRDEQAAGSVG